MLSLYQCWKVGKILKTRKYLSNKWSTKSTKYVWGKTYLKKSTDKRFLKLVLTVNCMIEYIIQKLKCTQKSWMYLNILEQINDFLSIWRDESKKYFVYSWQLQSEHYSFTHYAKSYYINSKKYHKFFPLLKYYHMLNSITVIL